MLIKFYLSDLCCPSYGSKLFFTLICYLNVHLGKNRNSKWGHHLFTISVLSASVFISAFIWRLCLHLRGLRKEAKRTRIVFRMERYLGRCGSRSLWSWLVSDRGQVDRLLCHIELGPSYRYSGYIHPGSRYHLPHKAGLQELGKPPCPFPQDDHCLIPLNQTQRI